MKSQTTGCASPARPFALPELGAQGGRFAAVGIAATLTHVLIVIVLMDVLGFRLASVANIIATLAGSAVSYCGNYFWTFRSSRSHVGSVARFATAYGLVFGLNALVMLVVADIAGVPYLIPLAAIIAVTPVLTFLLNRFWVFA